MLTKNKLNQKNLQPLSQAISSFLAEEGYVAYEAYCAWRSIFRNIDAGIQGKALHDFWMPEDGGCYCLCKEERDLDGSRVYTAYQLWIDPKLRSLAKVRRLVRFLRFYAQKQGYAKLVVISSRVDKIRAYARGLGKRFEVKNVVFVDEF